VNVIVQQMRGKAFMPKPVVVERRAAAIGIELFPSGSNFLQASDSSRIGHLKHLQVIPN
jgi:hypothetical protein